MLGHTSRVTLVRLVALSSYKRKNSKEKKKPEKLVLTLTFQNIEFGTNELHRADYYVFHKHSSIFYSFNCKDDSGIFTHI